MYYKKFLKIIGLTSFSVGIMMMFFLNRPDNLNGAVFIMVGTVLGLCGLRRKNQNRIGKLFDLFKTPSCNCCRCTNCNDYDHNHWTH